MDATAVKTGTEGKIWGGDNEPLKASYGKLMMWFFILSDALTLSVIQQQMILKLPALLQHLQIVISYHL